MTDLRLNIQKLQNVSVVYKSLQIFNKIRKEQQRFIFNSNFEERRISVKDDPTNTSFTNKINWNSHYKVNINLIVLYIMLRKISTNVYATNVTILASISSTILKSTRLTSTYKK